jgi:hypothetical protein
MRVAARPGGCDDTHRMSSVLADSSASCDVLEVRGCGPCLSARASARDGALPGPLSVLSPPSY